MTRAFQEGLGEWLVRCLMFAGKKNITKPGVSAFAAVVFQSERMRVVFKQRDNSQLGNGRSFLEVRKTDALGNDKWEIIAEVEEPMQKPDHLYSVSPEAYKVSALLLEITDVWLKSEGLTHAKEGE